MKYKKPILVLIDSEETFEESKCILKGLDAPVIAMGQPYRNKDGVVKALKVHVRPDKNKVSKVSILRAKRKIDSELSLVQDGKTTLANDLKDHFAVNKQEKFNLLDRVTVVSDKSLRAGQSGRIMSDVYGPKGNNTILVKFDSDKLKFWIPEDYLKACDTLSSAKGSPISQGDNVKILNGQMSGHAGVVSHVSKGSFQAGVKTADIYLVDTGAAKGLSYLEKDLAVVGNQELEVSKKLSGNESEEPAQLKKPSSDNHESLSKVIRSHHCMDEIFIVQGDCEFEFSTPMTHQKCAEWIRNKGNPSKDYNIVAIVTVSESPKVHSREFKAV